MNDAPEMSVQCLNEKTGFHAEGAETRREKCISLRNLRFLFSAPPRTPRETAFLCHWTLISGDLYSAFVSQAICGILMGAERKCDSRGCSVDANHSFFTALR